MRQNNHRMAQKKCRFSKKVTKGKLIVAQSVDNGIIWFVQIEWTIRVAQKGQTVYAFARGMDWKSRWLGVSKENPADTGEDVETIEKYDKLDDAKGSQYYNELMVAEQLLGAIFFGTVRHEAKGAWEPLLKL